MRSFSDEKTAEDELSSMQMPGSAYEVERVWEGNEEGERRGDGVGYGDYDVEEPRSTDTSIYRLSSTGDPPREEDHCLGLIYGCWYFLSVAAMVVSLAHIVAVGVLSELRVGGVWRRLDVGRGWNWAFGLGIAAAVVGGWLIAVLAFGCLCLVGKSRRGVLIVYGAMWIVGLLGIMLLILFALAVGFGWKRDALQVAAREAWLRGVRESQGEICDFQERFECRGFYSSDCQASALPIRSLEQGGRLCPTCPQDRVARKATNFSGQVKQSDGDWLDLEPQNSREGCFAAVTGYFEVWYLVIGFIGVVFIILLLPYSVVYFKIYY